ncbi:Acyl transferase/acyl hydrolase/lysophospholipase [Penicillium occitanis (nom. inval.)]|nr:Acyl transferase/acyl hydrolase/lysophospholipase [Penicillium occitanis (nom. inval.)]PCG88198.1 hypothetical protein PENOC_112110 [Penicillium occitanis (nom. inval.)]
MAEQRLPQRIAVLSFDGGGIRGYSSLLILENLMENISQKEGREALPCEYFDMIGGTSTGGIIAILLGCLRLSARDALKVYDKVGAAAFTPKRWHLNPYSTSGRYSATKLKEVAQTVLRENDFVGNNDSALFRNPDTVKTVVLAVTKVDTGRGPTLFRTYAEDEAYKDCKIWEIVRATSAATTFFEPMECGRDNTEFIDAGFGHNNPCEHILHEAQETFPNAEIACIVSIGTGLSGAIYIEDTMDIISALKKNGDPDARCRHTIDQEGPRVKKHIDNCADILIGLRSPPPPHPATRLSNKKWLGIVTVARVDAALAGNRNRFIDDLKNTIDRVLTDPAEYHRDRQLRHTMERFSNNWELNFEWSTAQWISGTYRGFRVGVPFPYDGDPTEPRIRRLGFYRAHVAAICNEEEQLNRLHTVDTLYAILDYIGLSD